MRLLRPLLALSLLVLLSAPASAAPAPARLTEDGADFVLLGHKPFR